MLRAKSPVKYQVNPPIEQINGVIKLCDKGQLSEALEQAKRLIFRFPSSITMLNILAIINQSVGQLSDAELCFQKMIFLDQNCIEAYRSLGNILYTQGKLDEAATKFQCALLIQPKNAEIQNNLGVILQDQGKFSEAITAFENAISIKPEYITAIRNLGNAFRELQKPVDALGAYQDVLALNPRDVDAQCNMGVIFQDQGEFDDAIIAYNLALDIDPEYEKAYFNKGVTLQSQHKLDAAVAVYQTVLSINPNYSEVYNNMGTALYKQGKFSEAMSAYERLIELEPNHADVHNNVGATLQKMNKLDEAIAAYERALAITPDYAEAALNMGLALQDQGKLLQAIDAYRRTLAIKPDYHSAKMYLRHMLGHVCDWQFYHQDQTACLHLGVNTSAIPTFAMLAIEDNPARQLARSRIWAKERYKEEPLPLPNRPTLLKKRLRVGYFSADFHDHATLHLMAGLLHNHDKSHFDIYLYSYGKHKSECWRKKLEKSGCRFFDCAQETDIQVLTLARTHNLDIAIDLKGYTQDTRSDIFQYRLAPIQVNYLGYPGSMAAKFIDYIVADPVIIPEQQRKHYSESVIYMPNSYQPTDNMRKILHTHTTRADFGLPKEAFIFCCFNNNYKISPYEFDIWMRTLSKVPGSVLWLIRSNKWVEQNLYREAEARSIDPSRIIFAEKVAHSEHLARHKHADLFLDTFNVNAHTTASDALWTGLPLITKVGDQFAARVSASLLTAVGLPELITTTAEDYETLILDFAQNPEKLIATKQKLTANLMKFPLFDTKLYTKNFERALKKAYYLYFNNQEPKDIFLNN